MSNRQFAGLASTTVASNVVSARAVASSPNVPLTPLEQAARLQGLAGPEMARKLFPSTADSIAAKLLYEPDYQREHRGALPYGLNGRTARTSTRKLAVRRRRPGATATRTFRLGDKPGEFAPDGERKNQTSQGWAVVDVAARLESGWDAVQRAQAAWSMFHDPTWTELIQSHVQTGMTFVQQFLPGARNEPFIDTLGHHVAQALPVVGLGGALLLGWETYREALAASSMFDDPALKGRVLPYMQAGMALGRAAQTGTVGVTSLAQLNILTFSAWEGLARAAEGAFLPVVLGGEALRVAIAYHQYRLGRVSLRDFHRSSAGLGILVVFVAGGAAVGAFAGFLLGGVLTVPGVMVFAKTGGLAAIPFQFFGERIVDNWYRWRDRKFNEEQRRLVDAAVETFYRLEDRHDTAQH